MPSNEENTDACTLTWSVGGMDCASCATKIRGALERLPGVEDVRVSVMGETLALSLDERTTSREKVEGAVRRLGYDIVARQGGTRETVGELAHDHEGHGHGGADHSGHAHSHSHGPSDPDKSWYQTGKGRLVIGTGLLLVAAWAIKFAVPGDASHWAFVMACLIGVFPVARRALAALMAGMPFTIEMLMTIASAGALVIGAAEEAALVVFLFAVGEVLEGVAADRARAGIRALGDLVPKTALLEENGKTREVEAASLRIGQTVLVRPGDRIPADGEITDGMASIDEAPVTGESVPKSKGPGEEVFAGSINTDAVLRVRVTRTPQDNTIARIIRLVEEAQEARAPTERFIDRFSRYYMPAIVGLAVLVALVPPLLAGQSWDVWIYRALALLLIGCPCALVISVPASIASSLSAAARRGLLMKGGAVIETAAGIQLVAFDKTGTLTVGRPVVTDLWSVDGDDLATLALAAGVEAGSSHPLAEAILKRAEEAGIAAKAGRNARAVAGRGVEAEIEGETAFVGSPRYAAEQGAMTDEARNRIEALEAEGKTVAAVFRAGRLQGIVALRDEPREDARRAVEELSSLGVRSMMLTGDNGRTAAAIAKGLSMEHRAELLPDDKVKAIRSLAEGDAVMMVGDGINDAPALAAAQIGVAMGSGTDVALETADAALLANRVSDVPALIRIARITMGNIRQNIAIALGLKAVFLVTTILGFTGLWIAVLADTGATVLVTLNALRLLRLSRGG
ncbi:heavy metal-translocating P-type ATPase [Nitratireductor indicus C115]|uniref:P-type Zn(2+) transporter n=1 Tax=Nitratireductor indicus C115 TaxID=1231190 RepID=K2NX82_9HYPH|nr:heavy metal translocating P-type ATPase [Nitratireductor indicus]EKF42494.1 heavy metal-translocating P-type ATPase [Nitratireductor indicus C115]SFQ56593.1 Cd2+/Zn2+-exporting ATPase [Nitratireductor indicus]